MSKRNDLDVGRSVCESDCTLLATEKTHYHRMSRAERARRQIDGLREPAIQCPYCETMTTVSGLLRHIGDTCEGEAPIHPLSKWVTWSDVIELGVSSSTLRRWVQYKKIRWRGERGRREYLLRDITRRIALLRRGRDAR